MFLVEGKEEYKKRNKNIETEIRAEMLENTTSNTEQHYLPVFVHPTLPGAPLSSGPCAESSCPGAQARQERYKGRGEVGQGRRCRGKQPTPLRVPHTARHLCCGVPSTWSVTHNLMCYQQFREARTDPCLGPSLTFERTVPHIKCWAHKTVGNCMQEIFRAKARLELG